jgi:hypothetical protein
MAKAKVPNNKSNNLGVSQELEAESVSVTETERATAGNSSNFSALPSPSPSSSTSHLERNGQGKLEEQNIITQAQNETLATQLSLSQQAQLVLEDKVNQIKRYLIQLNEDKQVLVEACQKADLELQRLTHTNRDKQRKITDYNLHLSEEQARQHQSNLALEVDNQRLQVEGDRLLGVKRATLEHNEGLTEDIILLEEIAQTLEQHAHELQATADLLRQRNRQLRSYNKELP